jgi:hypothetical protein
LFHWGIFNDLSCAWYFADSRDVAEQRRAWAERRSVFDAEETWLISIDVPNSLFQSLRTREVRFGQELREHV